MLAKIAYIALFFSLWALWRSRTSDITGAAVITSAVMAAVVCVT